MNKDEKKLLQLCLSSLKDKNIDEENYRSFFKDYTSFMKGALTFREVLASIKHPKGELKEAMQSHYDGSQYHRVFKNR
ncbi:MAG: hypothetical protein ACKVQC_09365 [Elusimicrobiota bacterium]